MSLKYHMTFIMNNKALMYTFYCMRGKGVVADN